MFELKHLNGFPMWSRFESNEILFVDERYRITTNHGQHQTKPLEILNAVTLEHILRTVPVWIQSNLRMHLSKMFARVSFQVEKDDYREARALFLNQNDFCSGDIFRKPECREQSFCLCSTAQQIFKFQELGLELFRQTPASKDLSPTDFQLVETSVQVS